MRNLLSRLRSGELNEVAAEAELRKLQLRELEGNAILDLGRQQRRGIPEVVLAEGKSPAEAATLTVRLALEQGQGVVSRMSAAHEETLRRAAEAAQLEIIGYRQGARLLRPGFTPPPIAAKVALITAGTSDLRASEEARMVVEAGGLESRIVVDVGVAGLHRLIQPLAELVEWDPDVFIVAAGMDGVLPGVVSGLVAQPVIGLPVSTGYGLGGQGEAALLTMLQSCSTA
ncbi:MAG: nickel pincer cofactor biosynthesis protein LarB, partial [Candidatus Dormibacteraceae bacterium]